ncbi:MAG: hypothetical protein NXI32_29455 [bacterium]|nr:hypothetical protein [bacterium]
MWIRIFPENYTSLNGQKMKTYILTLAAMIFLLSPSAGRCDLIYEIVFDQTEYNVEVGQTQTIDVFFREIRSGDSTAMLAIDGMDGLYAAGFDLDFSMTTPGSSAGPTFVSWALNDALDRFDPVFSQAPPPAGGVLQVNVQARDITSGVEVASFMEGGNDVFQVRLGTVSFQAEGPAGTTTTLALGSSGVELENLFADGTVPGSVRYGSASFNAVPEPSALVLVSAFFGVGCLYRRRRLSCM